MINRRRFLRGGLLAGAGLVAAPSLFSLAACGSDGGEPIPPGLVGGDQALLGLYPSAQVASSEDAVRMALAKMDLTWLKAGDTVLVKLASNSGNPHPAVTSPSAVRGVVKELLARGAGKVYVGDQAGAEHVRLTTGDVRFSSTQTLTTQNGLHQAIVDAGGEPHYFDDHGYEAGYFEGKPPSGSHWTQPLMLPNIVKQVDHIVYLPRLSMHVLCGCTVGHKIAMGFLRDDSRFHVHFAAEHIYEKYTEINYVPEIRSRFRLAVTLAEAMLLDSGPDEGSATPVDPRIVIASRSLASHDALATAVLVHFDATIPNAFDVPYDGARADQVNAGFSQLVVSSNTNLRWGPEDPGVYKGFTAHTFQAGISQDRALQRAFAIRGTPKSIPLFVDGAALSSEVETAITTWSEGRVKSG